MADIKIQLQGGNRAIHTILATRPELFLSGWRCFLHSLNHCSHTIGMCIYFYFLLVNNGGKNHFYKTNKNITISKKFSLTINIMTIVNIEPILGFGTYNFSHVFLIEHHQNKSGKNKVELYVSILTGWNNLKVKIFLYKLLENSTSMILKHVWKGLRHHILAIQMQNAGLLLFLTFLDHTSSSSIHLWS